MHRFRFNLLTLFGFVAIVAVGCAALARPSQLWLVVVSGASLAGLFYAVLAAVYGRNASRAFWVGVAVVGWGYVALEWAKIPFFVPTEFVTERLQAVLHAPANLPAASYAVATTAPSYSTWSTTPPGAPVAVVTDGVTVYNDYGAATDDTPLGLVPDDTPTSAALPDENAVPAESPPLEMAPGDAPPNGYADVSANSGYPVLVWSPAAPSSANAVDLEAFGQIAKWLWSPLLGFAGGLVALRLYHRRERQGGQRGLP